MVPLKPGNAGGGKGLTGRCIEEGKQCWTQSPGNNIVTETKSTISRQAVNLFEEPDAGNPQVRFCEGPGPTDTWLRYCGTAGKPSGKRRKQTSTCNIGRNLSTRLQQITLDYLFRLQDFHVLLREPQPFLIDFLVMLTQKRRCYVFIIVLG